MGQFATVVQRYMSARNMSVRATASAAGYSDHTLLSKVLNGHKPVTPYLAAKLDRALCAEGEIIAAGESAVADAKVTQAIAHPRAEVVSDPIESLRQQMNEVFT